METTVERVDDTKVKLSVTVEAERVDEAIDAAAAKLAEEVNVPGFRPGKVPRRVLETRLGKDALVSEAVREAVPRFYSEAAQAEELAVVGQPSFDIETFDAGQPGSFSATVEVLPEISVPDYQGMQIPHPDWELTEDEVREQLDAVRDRFARLEDVDRPAQVGDHVKLTLSGQRNGETVDEVSAEDTLYEISDPDESGSELDRNLVGAQPGSILRFTDTLGPDYGELAGAELDFTAIVKEVKAKQLPDLDDEFAQEATEFDTMAELDEELRRQLSQHKVYEARESLRGRVVEAVCAEVDPPLPESMVQEEVQHRLQRVQQAAEEAGMTYDQYLEAAGISNEEVLSRFEGEARQTVKAQLVVDAIGRDAGLELSREDLAQEIGNQAARMGREPNEVAQLLSQGGGASQLASDAFRRKTIDYLLDQVEVLSGPPEELIQQVQGPQVETDADSSESGADEGEAAEGPAAEDAAAEGPAAEDPAAQDRARGAAQLAEQAAQASDAGQAESGGAGESPTED